MRKSKRLFTDKKVVSILKEAGWDPQSLMMLFYDNFVIGSFRIESPGFPPSYYLYRIKQGVPELITKEITEDEYHRLYGGSKQAPRTLSKVEELLIRQEKVTVEDILNASSE